MSNLTFIQIIKNDYFQYPLLIIGAAIIGFGYVYFDFLGAHQETVKGTVIGEQSNWTVKHSYRCFLDIDTNLGVARSTYYGQCKHEWEKGDKVILNVKVGRLDRQLMVDERTIRRDYN